MKSVLKKCALAFIALAANTTFGFAQWNVTETEKVRDFTPVTKFIGGIIDARAPNGQPDGLVATANTGKIRKAWYAMPTTRYGHGIMGDSIEAGRLIVADAAGKQYGFVLPKRFVYEDRYPRLADLDGDGTAEIITILTDSRAGAAVAIYALEGSRLAKVAQTPHIGTPNRLRNIAGIADYNDDGQLEIMEVVTPHIGGTLNMWKYTGRGLRRLGSARGFSNHFIGSRNLELSASADLNGDGITDIAVPNARRTQLRLISGRTLDQIAAIDLDGRISGNIMLGETAGMPAFRLELDGSRQVVVHQNP